MNAVSAAIFAALFLAGPALAAGTAGQRLPPQQMQLSCAKDYAQFCTGSSGASPTIEKDCLKQYYLNLRASCKASIHAFEAWQASGGPSDTSDTGD